MDEVDGILIYTLKHLGCEVGSKIGELSPPQLIQCVTNCLKVVLPDLQLPDFDTNVSMSARYKVASQIAQAITDLGYKDEVGCQSFLYPTEEETRKILIFVVEKLPRDGEVGDRVETLLAKIGNKDKGEEEDELGGEDKYTNGVEVGGIRLPMAVDVDSLPKETLKFYASHLADLSFQKMREKYRNNNKVQEPPPFVPESKSEESDDDFGDPDVDVLDEKPIILPKPPVPIKPKIKAAVQEEVTQEDNKNITKSREEEEATARIKALQEDLRQKTKLIKEKEKYLRDSGEKSMQLQRQIDQLETSLNEKSKVLERLKKTEQLLSGGEDALEKVKTAVNSMVEKILSLSEQWEKHRKPLVEEIRQKKTAAEMSDSAKMREEIRGMKAKMKEMGQEAKAKEEFYNHLLNEYERLPKDMSRSSYTRRITEIIGNIKKQKKEIAKILADTKEIQKDINTLSGRLDRTFAVADELIYQLADKDKNVAQSYKLLIAIHSDFSRIIKTLEQIGNLKRQQRDLEDKLELEKTNSIEDKLNRLKADMAQMQQENRIVEAKLRDPTLQRNKVHQ